MNGGVRRRAHSTWSCSYPQNRRRGSPAIVVATSLSTSGLSPERLFSPTHLEHA